MCVSGEKNDLLWLYLVIFEKIRSFKFFSEITFSVACIFRQCAFITMWLDEFRFNWPLNNLCESAKGSFRDSSLINKLCPHTSSNISDGILPSEHLSKISESHIVGMNRLSSPFFLARNCHYFFSAVLVKTNKKLNRKITP